MSALDAILGHGGALDAASSAYGGRREDWLDLSTGINPSPPHLPPIPDDVWRRLPDRKLEGEAIEAARRFYGAPAEAGIVAAPGSQALISLLPFCLAPAAVAIVEPTYSEHRRAFEAAGHDVTGIAGLGKVPSQAKVVVVVNPNNPDGRLSRKADLLPLAAELAIRGGLLVVDEAFMDAEPAESLASETGRPGLLVHRSFGKVFGLAGLRLGFALTTPALASRLAGRLGPWATSGPALAVASDLMRDGAGLLALRGDLSRQSERLRATLGEAGLPIVGRTALFATIRHERAHALFEALCRRRILTRPFSHRTDWLRFGNPANDGEAGRLREALRSALAELGDA